MILFRKQGRDGSQKRMNKLPYRDRLAGRALTEYSKGRIESASNTVRVPLRSNRNSVLNDSSLLPRARKNGTPTRVLRVIATYYLSATSSDDWVMSKEEKSIGSQGRCVARPAYCTSFVDQLSGSNSKPSIRMRSRITAPHQLKVDGNTTGGTCLDSGANVNRKSPEAFYTRSHDSWISRKMVNKVKRSRRED
ncbi:hypothetical protein AG1IA_09739 [Rhizoctonia solani AG-1 IA]|uniref:Uncharacterized protein n=1 Tax=Thanatephorus cucumeris (strain AG1-IA) TaxID=983506 RepID=L8WDH4_THACA|nr:hypothetical protein AG1IA_09739 [Rhizoctonia solani AG-1 IA]